jgi:UDP-glucose 4-epimerase
MKTVLVTGVSGFLGQYVARHFDSLGWRVIGVDRGIAPADVRVSLRAYHRWNLPDVRFGDLLRESTPRLLVHCAGPSSVVESFAHPERDFADGPALVFEILSQLRVCSPRTQFMFLSSAAVYGNPASLPVSESAKLLPISPYATHKMQCESLCAEFAKDVALRTASVRIFSAYGAGLRRQVIWDILQKAMTLDHVILQGTGAESRDFIHAMDVARAIERVSNAGNFIGEAYNLASGREVTIAELAEQVIYHLGFDVRVRFDGILPPGIPRNWCGDVRKLMALGFTPSMSLENGLVNLTRSVRGQESMAA